MAVKNYSRTVSTTINKGNWEEKKMKLKEKFPQLTDSDLLFEEDKQEAFLDRIHSKIGSILGKTKIGVHRFIKEL